MFDDDNNLTKRDKIKVFLLLHAHVIGHAGMSHDIYILFDDNKTKTWS